MSNIINASFVGGRITRTAPAYQYDYGQILRFNGVELPDAYEVHFALDDSGNSVTQIGDASGVTIPDSMFLQGCAINAWVYLHTGEDDGETEYKAVIPILKRAKPTNATPTPVQQDAITQAIAALAEAVEKSDTNVEHYPKIEDGYWYVWDAESEQFVNTDVEAQGPQGETGQSGPQGVGISSVAKTGSSGLVDTYTITFTNGNTTTFTVANGEDGQTGPQGVGIASVAKTGSSGLIDTYTITFTNGDTTTFTVTNGEEGETGPQGVGIASVVKTGSSGLVDTYTITFTNGNTTTFTVTNGAEGAPGQGVPSGGTAGQILGKSSGTDYDTAWVDGDFVKYTAQSLTLTQKKQALLNLDGIRVIELTSGTTTLAELTAMIAGINTDGEHVFFDTSSLGYPLYLCTIAINYTDSTPTSYRLSDLVTGAVSVGDYDGTITLAEILGAAAVVRFPVGISVTTQPTKTTYEIGESFDPTGMVVTAMLSDGSTEIVDNSDLTFNPASFSTENAQTSVTVTYQSGYYTLTTTLTVEVVAIIPNTWAKRVQVSAAGLGPQYFEVGEVITDTYTVGQNTFTNHWLVMGFRDVETEDGVVHQNVPIIQMQYTTHEDVVFDPSETTEATEETAQAGYYYCGYDGTNYTMLNLSTGAAIPYSSYTKVYKTLWNSVNAIRYGLNNWKLSFARQYMNGLGTGWAAPQHACDVLPANAASMTGFKSYMPSDMLAALHPIKIKTRQPNYMGGALDETLDLFWLASISEMNMQNSNASPDDGTPWEYYKELFESDSKVNTGTYDVMKRYAINATTIAQYWWTRSANLGGVTEWIVYASGYVITYVDPSSSRRLLPACAII